jgi:hypothetical protein
MYDDTTNEVKLINSIFTEYQELLMSFPELHEIFQQLSNEFSDTTTATKVTWSNITAHHQHKTFVLARNNQFYNMLQSHKTIFQQI